MAGKGAKGGTLPHPAKKAPVVTRDEKKGEITIEVDKTKAKKPYRFFSYSTAKKVGIAQTTFGGALLSLNSLTIQPDTMFIEIYIFFVPGLLVIFGGSFAIRAGKVKRRKIRYCLMLTSVVFSIFGFLAALAVETRACLLLLEMTELNILYLLLQVVALGVLPVSALSIMIALDSVFCGRHRPGYSMTLKVVYKIENLGDLEDAQANTVTEIKGEDMPNDRTTENMKTNEDRVSTEKTLPVQHLETLQVTDVHNAVRVVGASSIE
jgi:hypothetical protein